MSGKVIAVGDWLKVYKNGKYYIGYLYGIEQSETDTEYQIVVTQIDKNPINGQVVRADLNYIKPFIHMRLHKEDYPDLIELSLMTHDEKWFNKLIKQYKEWK